MILPSLLAVAIVVELCNRSRNSRLLIYLTALVMTYSGTGLVVLAVCLPLLVIQRQRWDLMAGAGLEVVLGTPSATPPRWMLDRHPGMLPVGADGRVRDFGSRRHYDFSHAGYREEAARMAVENDVHVLGVSSLAGGHKTLVPDAIAELARFGRPDILVVVGGVVPPQDRPALIDAGVTAVFGPGSAIPVCAQEILGALTRARG